MKFFIARENFLENSPQLTLAQKQQRAGGTVLSFKIKGTKME